MQDALHLYHEYKRRLPAIEEGGQRVIRLVEPLVREWLMDLRVLGRSPRTIAWYAQKMSWYLRNGGAQRLEELTTFELKRYLADLQSRGLAPNTVHPTVRGASCKIAWSLQAMCRSHRLAPERNPECVYGSLLVQFP